MPLSLKDRIAKYLKGREWINGREIEELAMRAGYKSSNASRRCRELCKEEILERQMRKGKGVASVWYRWKAEVTTLR